MSTVVITIIILGFIILVHELGHFVAARRADVMCHEFSIGFGPALYTWHSGETRFAIRVIPLGGYVIMAGEVVSPAEEGAEEEDAPWPPAEPGRNIGDKSVPTRMLVFAAGSLTNFLAAIVVFFIVFAAVGIPQVSVVLEEVEPGYPAAEAGLRSGDRILSIDGVQIQTWQDVVETVQDRPNREVVIVVQRDGRQVDLLVNVGTSPEEEDIGYIGVLPRVIPVRTPIPRALTQAVTWTLTTIVMLAQVFIRMLGGETGNLLGVVGLGAEVGRAAELGLANVLWMVGAISASVGFFQLLPIPSLDGSRLLFLLIEAVRGRPMDPEREGLINMIGFAFLVLLIIYVTFQDITRLIE